VLDTGTSAVLVSPYVARVARLVGRAGTFELAPDGTTHMDRETTIPLLNVADLSVRNVRALISSNLYGTHALCGYDFFMRFPTLIDRVHSSVTLFPSPGKTAHLNCLVVDLRAKVPLATIQINDTWLSGIVLDSGMAGGGALWRGVLDRLHQPPFESDGYAGSPAQPSTSAAVRRFSYALPPEPPPAICRYVPRTRIPMATTASSKRTCPTCTRCS
jgi:hypothetical protein